VAKAVPPKGFAGAGLRIHEVPAGQRFGRIYLDRYPDPLGFGKTRAGSAIHGGASLPIASACSISGKP
jgi:hypothetical protein